MKTAAVNNFNLKATLESGQVFRWERIGEWYYITAAATIIKIKQDENKIIYASSDKNFDVINFFDLRNRNYDSLIKNISRSDKKVSAAVKKYYGLRIIKQESWECTASFICSSFSNIKRIKKNVNAIAEKFGKKTEFEGYASYLFPTAKAIAKNSKKLDKCGLGYREKYLTKTARAVSNGFDFNRIRGGSYEEAKKSMTKLAGVGDKVADCILLFSLGFTEAFPVDVWMEKIMRANRSDKKLPAKKLAAAGREKYGKNAGYAQQFLYHYARNESFK